MITYGLIGFPLRHSFSAAFFTEKFEREGIDAEYLNFELEDIAEIGRVLRTHPQLRGLNITIPYKEAVIPLLDALSPEAEKIGAVNVIRIERLPGNPCPGGSCPSDRRPSSLYPNSPCPSNHHQGDSRPYRLTGFNTDCIGFRDSLLPLLHPGQRPKALILGTGGASKAVAQVLTDLAVEWSYVSRTYGNNRFTYREINGEIISAHRLIVNTTPLGMFPHIDAAPDIPYDAITPRHLLYDLVYNPSETLFLQKGKARGATVRNGVEMLRLQALAAWEIWKEQYK